MESPLQSHYLPRWALKRTTIANSVATFSPHACPRGVLQMQDEQDWSESPWALPICPGGNREPDSLGFEHCLATSHLWKPLQAPEVLVLLTPMWAPCPNPGSPW